MNWLEITVHTLPEGVEPVAEMFREIGAGGVVIEDPAVILNHAARTHPDEWAVPAGEAVSGPPRVKGYLPVDEGLAGRLEQFWSALSRLPLSPGPEVTTRTLAEEDWANAWRAYYKPVRTGQRLVVKPSWEDYTPGAGELVIELDPGMAFGCGTHATTSLCLGLLEKYVREGMTACDVGTGSGILAIAAAKLGAGRVVAVDLDPVACRVAAENVQRNGLTGRVQVVQGNLLDSLDCRADLVVSNIIADVIIGFAPDAAKALVPGGIFIASGIINHRAAGVRAAVEAAGLAVREQLEKDQWVALAAEKEGKAGEMAPDRVFGRGG
ncbi:MAG: 50S ribosomal protein L11 methyltransferase [Peptococcaceae bacterium]|nr:50S ribosomal protein L11 methyltransferase [Peptococcaceae bacterium]